MIVCCVCVLELVLGYYELDEDNAQLRVVYRELITYYIFVMEWNGLVFTLLY